jgi:predicted enzyme related to lactoylglutathione lyase
VDWPYDKKWWGEGDVLIWTDENGWPPSYHGTGSEEYFNSGWCTFDRKAVSGFVTTRPGHPTVFSFHLNDAFQFQRNIQVVAEQVGAAGGQQIIDKKHPLWTTTAYWYADPAKPFGSH